MNNVEHIPSDEDAQSERRGGVKRSTRQASKSAAVRWSCPSHERQAEDDTRCRTTCRTHAGSARSKAVYCDEDVCTSGEYYYCCGGRRRKSVKRSHHDDEQQQQLKSSWSSSVTAAAGGSGERVGPRVKKALLAALALMMGDSTKLLHSHGEKKNRRPSGSSSTGDEKKKVCINIAGKRFETYETTLQKSPHSLLSLPQRDYFYDPVSKEFFFDRNRKAFSAILTYCQSGVLVKPPSLDERIFCAELRFFGFDDEADAHSPPSSPSDADRLLPDNKFQRRAWELFEYPDTSLPARIVALFSVTIIILSIVMFCVETLPEFKIRVPIDGQTNSTAPIRYTQKPNPKYEPILYLIECICISWFTLEYLVRLISSPKKVAFLYQLLNVIDVVAILPFYVTLILSSTNTNMSSLSILRVLRLVRVFRIFKLSRYSKGLKILGYTFRASLQELGLLAFFLAIGIVLFASAAYYCEESVPDTKFESIPHSFWWAIVTMTTVGYGDMYPETLGGKLVGSFCVLIGVLAIAFPVPVIVNNFTYYYTLEQVAPEPLDSDYICSPLGRARKASTWSRSVGDESSDVNTPLTLQKPNHTEEELQFIVQDTANGGTELNGNDQLNLESNV